MQKCVNVCILWSFTMHIVIYDMNDHDDNDVNDMNEMKPRNTAHKKKRQEKKIRLLSIDIFVTISDTKGNEMTSKL